VILSAAAGYQTQFFSSSTVLISYLKLVQKLWVFSSSKPRLCHYPAFYQTNIFCDNSPFIKV